MPVKVEGGAELRALSLRLKAAGEVELKRAMYANLRRATLPAREAVQASERAELPKRGGLNEWVASTPVGHRTLIGPRSAGVTIVQSKKGRAKPHDLRRANDEGNIRHPRFGRRGKGDWFDESIPTGWWERGLSDLAPGIALGMRRTISEVDRVAGFHGPTDFLLSAGEIRAKIISETNRANRATKSRQARNARISRNLQRGGLL